MTRDDQIRALHRYMTNLAVVAGVLVDDEPLPEPHRKFLIEVVADAKRAAQSELDSIVKEAAA